MNPTRRQNGVQVDLRLRVDGVNYEEPVEIVRPKDLTGPIEMFLSEHREPRFSLASVNGSAFPHHGHIGSKLFSKLPTFGIKVVFVFRFDYQVRPDATTGRQRKATPVRSDSGNVNI